MFKKTLISLAVASSLGLTGCFDSANDGANANPSPKYSDAAGKTFPAFNPAKGQLPLPNDLIFRQNDKDTEVNEADGTFEVANTSPPVTAALNQLSGASTVAPAVIQTSGQLDPSTVVAGKTVHLIELAYASGDPVRALSISEPPTLAIAQGSAPVEVRADVETLDGTSAIRILPLKPLNPQKRYVVLVTTGVMDINGDPIIQDPVYANITSSGTEDNPEKGLVNAALLPVRTLVNKLWEPIALKYAGAIGAQLTEDDIALTYSFTTSNDEKVLHYIAEPGVWFADQVSTFVATSAAKKAVNEGAKTFEQVKLAVDGAIGQFPASLGLDPASPPPAELVELIGPGAICAPNPEADFIGQAIIDCLGIGLATGFKDSLPTPTQGKRADSIELDPQLQGVAAISAVAASVLEAVNKDSVLAVQGTIKLPNYLGNSPAELVGATAAGDMLGNWVADDDLAKDISSLLAKVGAPPIPQSNPEQTGTTAVNYIFPFPKLNAAQPEVEAPILILYPSDPSIIQGVVSFQHGITTDRSTALTFGSALAEQGYIVAAIDHPLHGVPPFSAEKQLSLAQQLLGAALLGALPADFTPPPTQEIQALGITSKQQFIGYIASTLAPEAVTALQEADPVAYFKDQAVSVETIDLGLPQGTISAAPAFNDNSIMSLLATVDNAGSRVPGLAPRFDGESIAERHFGFYPNTPGLLPLEMDYDLQTTKGADGNGRFFINLQNFLKTRDNLRQSSVDQMNLRVALEGLQLPHPAGAITVDATNMSFAGHSLGGITGVPFISAVNKDTLSHPGIGKITFFPIPEVSGPVMSSENNVSAASLLASGGGIVRLLENSESFAPQILGGLLASQAALEQGDAGLETFFNVAQASVDSADPINFIANMTVPTLISMVISDNVIPNAADEKLWGGALLEEYGDAYDPSPLSGMVGSFPLEVRSFRAPLAGTVPLIELGSEDVFQLMPYTPAMFPGVNHGTPVDPTSSADAFGAMVCSTLTVFDSNAAPTYCGPN